MTRIWTIGGFTETDGRETGMHGLYRDIIAPYDRRDGLDAVRVLPWRTDWKDEADLARRDSVHAAVIIAYSWGAGWGAQRLAEALGRNGIPVRLMLLCDPVYRPLWLPAWGFANLLGFRAVIPNSATIQVPSNVERVLGLRQTGTRPKGHPIEWNGVTFRLPAIHNTSHTAIDSHPAWRTLVRSELANLFP